MKKIKLFSFAIAIFAVLQSCSITSENTYHNDASSSMLMTVNMKEAMGFINGMGGSDSAKAPVKFPKYSKVWESLYDSEKKKALEKGEKFAPAEDTARVMKKLFTKMNVDDKGEMEGMSIKFDRLTTSDLKILTAKNSKTAEPMTATNIGAWDGKKLVLDMTKLNADAIMNNGEKPTGEDKAKDKEAMKNMLKMFKMTFTNTIKFDQKIKSIQGKHDWITQKDDRTLLLTLNLSELSDDVKKLKNQDSKITIITE